MINLYNIFLQIRTVPQKWGVTEWATIATTVATIIYTLGTFLLWKTTKKSIDLTRQQMKRSEDVLEQAAIQTVYKNFRELYTLILQDERDAEVLANTQNVTKEKLRERYIGSFLINHVFEIFCMYERKLIPDEFWKRVVRDMKVLFSWKFIIDRWNDIRTLYPPHFQQFIDDEITQNFHSS